MADIENGLNFSTFEYREGEATPESVVIIFGDQPGRAEMLALCDRVEELQNKGKKPYVIIDLNGHNTIPLQEVAGDASRIKKIFSKVAGIIVLVDRDQPDVMAQLALLAVSGLTHMVIKSGFLRKYSLGLIKHRDAKALQAVSSFLGTIEAQTNGPEAEVKADFMVVNYLLQSTNSTESTEVSE